MSKAILVEGAIEAGEYVAGAIARGLGKVKPESERLLESAQVPPPVGRAVESVVPKAAEKAAELASGGSFHGRLARMLQRAQETNSDALFVSKNGQTIAHWHSGGQSVAIETNSITKSLTNLAIGKLVGQGKVSLSEPVHNYFTEWMIGPHQDVTIRHLLSHTSGLPMEGATRGLEGSLAAELKATPGTAFEYSNAGADVLSGVAEYASGKRLDRFVADEFFKPLGIKDYSWKLDEYNHAWGSAGAALHAQDLHKIGKLVADNGTWNGNQLISPAWIAESTKPAQQFNLYSGMLWWLDGAKFKGEARLPNFAGSDGFSSRGYNGQYIVVYPKDKLIGVRQIANEKHKFDSDDFKDFPKLLKDLARD